MNVFEAVKQSVSTRQVAEAYGLCVNRAGMTNCPFHRDRTPSMKVDKRFHCFGCGADGDVIDFAAKLFEKGTKEAAELVASNFGIFYDDRSHAPLPRRVIRQKSDTESYKEAEKRCFHAYADYFHLLRQWETQYAPQPGDTSWHSLFTEALQQKSYVEYLLDVLLYGTLEEKTALVAKHEKEVVKLEKRFSELTTGNERIGCADRRENAAEPQCRRSPGRSGTDR